MISYNHAQYLRQTIASVLLQSLNDLELILVDNGSTDGSSEIISQIKDSRFTFFQQENLGVSIASNVGISKARGKWIAIASSDDLWFEDKLKVQLDALEKKNAGASFTAVELINDDGVSVTDQTSADSFKVESLSREKLFEKFFFESNFLCATSALLRRDLLDGREFDPTLIQLQDFDMWIKLIKKCNFLIQPEKLVGYRVRNDGLNLSLDERNKARVQFELELVYRRFFEELEHSFFLDSFREHFRFSGSMDEAHVQFEQAFLYLKMGEPAIKKLGVEKLYSLMSSTKGRSLAKSAYGLELMDLWELAKTPIFMDSATSQSNDQLRDRVRVLENECDFAQKTIAELSSGKLWELRHKMHSILRKLTQ